MKAGSTKQARVIKQAAEQRKEELHEATETKAAKKSKETKRVTSVPLQRTAIPPAAQIKPITQVDAIRSALVQCAGMKPAILDTTRSRAVRVSSLTSCESDDPRQYVIKTTAPSAAVESKTGDAKDSKTAVAAPTKRERVKSKTAELMATYYQTALKHSELGARAAGGSEAEGLGDLDGGQGRVGAVD